MKKSPQPRQRTADEPYWIVSRRQLQLLASPVRQDLLDRLAAAGPMSVADLAAMLSMKATALYRHLGMLEKAGLVTKAGARIRNRRAETLYSAPARRLLLEKAFETSANAPLLGKIAAATTRQLARDAARGFGSAAFAPAGPGRTFGFARRVGAPNAAELASINRKLAEISAILRRSSARQNSDAAIAFGWVMAPVKSRKQKRKKRRAP